MSHVNHSRLLDVRKLTTEEIIGLIKNDEHYSSCCKIIEERNLNGQDLLNLTEIQISIWKAPKWLSRNLLALKTSLLKNPEIFLQEEEKTILPVPTINNRTHGSKKDFANKLETLYKPQGVQIPVLRNNISAKEANTNQHLNLTNVEADVEEFYDENNYLQPLAINNIKQRIGSQVKPPLKLPQLERSPKNIQKGRAKSPISSRKPIALPREDLEDEENEYELAPDNSHINTRVARSSPLPPPPPEENNDYEQPPTLVHNPSSQLPFGHTSIPRLAINKSDEEVYEDPDSKVASKYKNKQKKSPSATFYSTNVEIPPPLPKRPPLKKPEEPKQKNFNLNFSQYINVTRIFTSDKSTTQNVATSAEKNDNTIKTSSSLGRSKSDIRSENVFSGKRSWSTVNRPLPPIPPPIAKESPGKSVRQSRGRIENEVQKNNDQDFSEPEAEYQNQPDVEYPEEESLPEYLNTVEPKDPSKLHSPPEQKPKSISQVAHQPQITQLISQISEVKLKSTNKNTLKKEVLDNSGGEDRRKKLLGRRFGRAENNETQNDQNRSESFNNKKPQFKLPLAGSPQSFLNAHHFDQVKDQPDVDTNVEEDETEDLPEYLNTVEPNVPSRIHSTPEPKQKLVSQVVPQSLKTQLLSQITEAKGKLSNATPKKENLLDDAAAEDLRRKLSKRTFGRKENKANEETRSENFNRKFQSKLPLPPPVVLAQSFPNPHHFDQNVEDEGDEYVDVPEDDMEDLPEYLNTVEPNVPSRIHSTPEPKQKPLSQVIPQSLKTQLLSQITEAKGKLSNATPKKENLLDDAVAEDLSRKLSKRTFGRKENKENDETRSENFNRKFQFKLPLPPPVLAQSFPNPHHFNQNVEDEADEYDDVPEDDMENLPEYLNTVETKGPSRFPSPPEPNPKPVSQVIHQSLNTQLLSQITEVKRKLSNTNPIKEILLDDSAAQDLRKKLAERFGKKEYKENQNEPSKSENFNAKFPLPLPPSSLPQNYPSAYHFDQDVENEPDDEFDESEEDEIYDDIFNLNNEKFYRNTDRKGARLLLQDLEDGAFVLRPSKKFFLSITIKRSGKYFNLGVVKTARQKIYCGEGLMRTPEFPSIKTFLEHFEHIPLTLQGENGLEEVYLKKALPVDRF